jgi:hypothetical protein
VFQESYSFEETLNFYPNKKILIYIDLFDEKKKEEENYKIGVEKFLEITKQKFDVKKFPFNRYCCIKYEKKKFIFFINLPHLFFDGIFILIFFKFFFI